MQVSGTIHNYIERILTKYPIYSAFRSGHLTREDYYTQLKAIAPELKEQGLSEDMINLSTRFPLDEEKHIDDILLDLKEKGVIETTSYDKEDFLKYRENIYSNYQHENFYTFIFPEEERLIYALTQIIHPKSVIFLGSYYGYWGIWAMPAVQASRGTAYFVDVDQEVNKLAEINLKKFGYQDCSYVFTQDAVEFMQQRQIHYDFAVLDAEGENDHPDPDYRGKAVYYPLIRECSKYLLSFGNVICHNILLKNLIDNSYFEQKIQKNMQDFSKFIPFVQTNYSVVLDYSTSEGVGIFRKC